MLPDLSMIHPNSKGMRKHELDGTELWRVKLSQKTIIEELITFHCSLKGNKQEGSNVNSTLKMTE